GKTALVQRLYNILYTRNDPKIIPFYFRVPEGKMTTLDYCKLFMRSLLSQILGFKLRKPEYIRTHPEWDKLEFLLEDEEALQVQYRQLKQLIAEKDPGIAWDLTREAGHNISLMLDVKIIQVIDEFQYLNEHIYTDRTFTTREHLATFYQKTGSSKVSPQIITGSYIGWLTSIVNHMVGRYFHYYLDRLPENEAVGCVYRYAAVFGQEVTDESAAYLAAVCDNDPYYIASLFQHPGPDKNLCDEASIRATLDSVTSAGGAVANMWLEYILSAFKRINDRVAKKVVLYLAHHDPMQRARRQILEDCAFDIDEEALEKRLQQLVYADLIRQGEDSRTYQGLGDPIFAMVFRKRYQSEIDDVSMPR
ncbi:MAG: hypothetical protein GY807_18460, partial [Gammaproteobacteria bacterium]|nr:hypothetical protein [Gammaproteobacteria bacterium]